MICSVLNLCSVDEANVKNITTSISSEAAFQWWNNVPTQGLMVAGKIHCPYT